MRRLTAAWMVPVEGAPVAGGAVLIDDAGRIAEAGADHEVSSPPGAETQHYPAGAIVPGLVNTHTHLELTGLTGYDDPTDFLRWIADLRVKKFARGPADFLAAARQGLRDCYAGGVTTIADTGDSGAVIEALAQAGGSGIAYQEVFGPHPNQRDDSLASVTARIAELRAFASGRAYIGVSPHAPYSVSAELYEAVALWARQQAMPIAVHVAESAAEWRLVVEGEGPFADQWVRRGIPVPDRFISPVELLKRHHVLSRDTLCIHVVKVHGGDIERIQETDSAVAHCPLSNLAHGHGNAKLRALRDAGIRVGLGTDSVMSVGTLDLMAAGRKAAELAGLDAAAVLRLCTLDGARALKLHEQLGSIVPGKWADLAVIETGTAADPLPAIVASGPADVLATWLGGREVHTR